MEKKNKKPNSVITKSGVALTYPDSDPGVAYVRAKGIDSIAVVGVTKAEAKELGESLLEFSAYEPEHWIPTPGQSFWVMSPAGNTEIVFMRLLEDLPNRPAGTFSFVQLTGDSRGYVGSMELDNPMLRPSPEAELDDKEKAFAMMAESVADGLRRIEAKDAEIERLKIERANTFPR